MLQQARSGAGVFWRAGWSFVNDNCFAMAGALAYYTIFSLPPLMVIVVAIAGAIFGEEAARGEIERQFSRLIGETGASGIQDMIERASRPSAGSIMASALGLGALLFGATGAFAQLQLALNTAWHVQPDPTRGGVRNFLVKRVLSFGIVVTVGFILIVSLLVSALIAAFGGYLTSFVSSDVSAEVLQAVNSLLSLVFLTFFFAAVYKVLPDAKIAWKDVWVGAIFTSVLFGIGKTAIGYYIGQQDFSTTYGAAGSLVIVLLWIYYSALILLFGAEFTHEWTKTHHHRVHPEPGAVKVKQKEVVVERGADPAET